MPLDLAWLDQGLAVDLANTYVPAQAADLLGAWPERERWPAVADAELGALRAAVTALLDAAAVGKPLPPPAVALINATSATDPERVTLEEGRAVRRSGLPGAAARATIELLAGADGDRLARCAAPGCGMFFLARHPRQAWCCAACGNRARVARHYARRGVARAGGKARPAPGPRGQAQPPAGPPSGRS